MLHCLGSSPTVVNWCIWSLTLLWLAYFWVLSQVQMSSCWYLYIDLHCNPEGVSVVIDLRRLEN